VSGDFIDLPQLLAARGRVCLPGSKSISNRVLLLAALAVGKTELRELLVSDDTARMLDALRALGVDVELRADNAVVITGCGGMLPVRHADLFLGNAGTAFRPLTAVLAFSGGHYQLAGVPRMHERPIADLVDGLRQLGADIRYLGVEGFPPLAIRPPASCALSTVRVRGDVSSQFLTGLLMALPLRGVETTVEVVGELISKPYVDITLASMARFGVQVLRDGWRRFTVPAGSSYRSPGVVYVEGDASSASYFLALGAIGGGPLRVEGVGLDSIQGDVRFADALAGMGARITSGANWIEASSPLCRKLLAGGCKASNWIATTSPMRP
jgi:3-phosphoshikimate 1-carboxyvinyltransferase